jgi:hypothetical protein
MLSSMWRIPEESPDVEVQKTTEMSHPTICYVCLGVGDSSVWESEVLE